MPIFLQEDSKELNQQKYFLSKNGRDTLNANIAQMEAMGLEQNDGYKLLKHLQDEEYNEGKEKKDEKTVKDPNVHTETDKKNEENPKGVLNKTVEGGIHNNKTSNDEIMHHFTDWVYGKQGEFTQKHKANQNRLDHTATKPLKIKQPKIEEPAQVKPLKAPNGSDIHIKENKKTIKITENQIQKILDSLYL